MGTFDFMTIIRFHKSFVFIWNNAVCSNIRLKYLKEGSIYNKDLNRLVELSDDITNLIRMSELRASSNFISWKSGLMAKFCVQIQIKRNSKLY